MNQKVLKGQEIFSHINKKLTNAKKEILVVSAWFTDEELLNTLILKAKEGINVKVIIAENKDNEKLDFSNLIKNGGSLILVKKKGYGMLHEKYCIIDQKSAFHGSYNWTNNAKKNNSESVILTDHKDTVNQLIKDFYAMQNKINETENNSETEDKNFLKRLFGKKVATKIEVSNTENLTKNEMNKESAQDEMDKIFNSMISAEITQTDEGLAKEKGHNLAEEVNGDHQVLPNAMNSLYHLYISDKTTNEDNRARLVQKIDNKSKEFTLKVDANCNQKLNSLEIASLAKNNDLESQKTKLESDKAVLELKNKFIAEEKIPNLEIEIENKNSKKSNLKVDFIKPAFKWHTFIPLALFFVGLAALMFLFYSSSAYIMLYSYDDAMLAIENGIKVNPQVFEEGALRKAFEKSLIAGVYISFFVFIPFAIAYVAHTAGKISFKNLKAIIPYVIIFMIDAFIAFKVTQTINKIDWLTGVSANHESSFTNDLSDINFWLVFFLGAIPFIFLAELMNRLIVLFTERTPELEEKRMQFIISELDKEISVITNKINEEKTVFQENKLAILKLSNEIDQIDKNLIYLPEETDKELSSIKENTENKKAIIANKASIFKNDIENDNIKISLTALKNRIALFIEGWDEWLHKEFSFERAISISQLSKNEIEKWVTQNVEPLNN